MYKSGDIVMVRFPFSDLVGAKKRPVLVVKGENKYGDFVCFQITSNKSQTDIAHIENGDLTSGELRLASFVKYDKCFTINSQIVEKSIASVSAEFLLKIKNLFCESIKYE